MAKEGRVFVRGMTSQTYGLSGFRNAQLELNRVRSESIVTDDATVAHSGDSEESRTWWLDSQSRSHLPWSAMGPSLPYRQKGSPTPRKEKSGGIQP